MAASILPHRNPGGSAHDAAPACREAAVGVAVSVTASHVRMVLGRDRVRGRESMWKGSSSLFSRSQQRPTLRIRMKTYCHASARRFYPPTRASATRPVPLPGKRCCIFRNGAVPARFTVPITLPPGWKVRPEAAVRSATESEAEDSFR